MTNDNRPFVHSPDLDPQIESAVWSVLSEPIDMDAVERVKIRAESLSNSHQQFVGQFRHPFIGAAFLR